MTFVPRIGYAFMNLKHRKAIIYGCLGRGTCVCQTVRITAVIISYIRNEYLPPAFHETFDHCRRVLYIPPVTISVREKQFPPDNLVVQIIVRLLQHAVNHHLLVCNDTKINPSICTVSINFTGTNVPVILLSSIDHFPVKIRINIIIPINK